VPLFSLVSRPSSHCGAAYGLPYTRSGYEIFIPWHLGPTMHTPTLPWQRRGVFWAEATCLSGPPWTLLSFCLIVPPVCFCVAGESRHARDDDFEMNSASHTSRRRCLFQDREPTRPAGAGCTRRAGFLPVRGAGAAG